MKSFLKIVLAAVLAVASLFATLTSAQMSPPQPTPTTQTVLFVGTLSCETYAGMYGILAGYTMGTAYFDVYPDWTYRYTGGCSRPATRLVGNRVVNFTGVTYLDNGATSGGGIDNLTYTISIEVGQLNDDGGEFYSNVRVGGWHIAGANANISFNPGREATINFYFPLASHSENAAFRQVNCRFFIESNGTWRGLISGTDYQNGGRNTASISIGQCVSSPSNITVPPTPGIG